MIDRASVRRFVLATAAAHALWTSGEAQARQGFAANGGAQIDPNVAPDDAAKADHDLEKRLTSDAEHAPQHLSPVEAKPLGSPPALVSDTKGDPGEPRAATSSALEGLKQNEFVRVGGALAIVLGLLFAIRGVVRRSASFMGGGARPSGVIEILARYPVGKGQSLLLLKVGRRIVLLHQNGTSMTALSEVREPDEVASLLSRMEAGADSRSALKFSSTLEQFTNETQKAVKSNISRRTVLPRGEAEIIDLTRRNRGVLASLFGWNRGGA